MSLVLDPPAHLAARKPPACQHGPCLLFKRDSEYYYACSASRGDSRFCSMGGPTGKKRKRGHDAGNLAQYYFTRETVDFVCDRIVGGPYGFTKVLCLGCPTIFRAIESSTSSLLLDLDHRRYRRWCPPDRFVRFNMFNGHFFDADGRSRLQNFLKQSAGSTLVLVDPPFGGLVQCLGRTLQQLREQFCSNQPFSVVLFFPYFNEHWVQRAFGGSVRVTDFVVTYEKQPSNVSPVRIFTDLDLGNWTDWNRGNIRYRWCNPCARTVFDRNKHCKQCGACTARDVSKTTRHCDACGRCCKSNWQHCPRCGRCHLPSNECV